jgi:hypothetical protein
MTYRQELAALIANGVSAKEIFEYFSRTRNLSRAAIIRLLQDNGVGIALPHSDDDISDERRRQIQQLSLE